MENFFLFCMWVSSLVQELKIGLCRKDTEDKSITSSARVSLFCKGSTFILYISKSWYISFFSLWLTCFFSLFSFIYLFTYLFVYLFIYIFIYLFIFHKLNIKQKNKCSKYSQEDWRFSLKFKCEKFESDWNIQIFKF